jgi:predicted nucleic acid-binding protein
MSSTRDRDLPVATPAAILAEVFRGRPADAGVFAALRRERVQVYLVDTRSGVRAGELLGMARAGSELAVDAFVVATADLAGGAIVATVDVSDMQLLAAGAANVAIADLN